MYLDMLRNELGPTRVLRLFRLKHNRIKLFKWFDISALAHRHAFSVQVGQVYDGIK